MRLLIRISWCLLICGVPTLGLSLRAAPIPGSFDDSRPRTIEKQTEAINRLLARAWREQGLKPAGRVSDLEFLRRVSLDLIGRIASLDEIRDFQRDSRPDRRQRLVERLLRSPEYAEHWADVWTGWLLPEVCHPEHREQLRHWLRPQLARGASYRSLAEQLLTASGKSSDNPATHYILALRGQPVPEDEREAEGNRRMEQITWRSVKLFLGKDIYCTMCHNHPFDPAITQRHFWGMNVFFRQTEIRGGDDLREQVPSLHPGSATWPAPDLELFDNPQMNRIGQVFYEKRNGVVLATRPIFLDDWVVALPRNRSRRAVLAEQMVKHANFNRVLVNRYWGQLFGRGMNEGPAVDDFGEHNPEVHPELLNRLTLAFEESGQDFRKLLSWICVSDAYQQRWETHLPSNPAGENQPKADEFEAYFSWMPYRPLSAEQRLRSLLLTLRTEQTLATDRRDRLRQTWRKAHPGEELWHLQLDSCYRPLYPNADGETARLMLSSPEIQDALKHSKGTVARLLKQTPPDRRLEELYLTVHNRYPTIREVERLEKSLGTGPLAQQNDPRVWEDVLWALLTGRECELNR